MAAMRPIAVANRASAIPGATTASEVFFEAAIDWKLDMMPQTVPNRPTKGPADPTAGPERATEGPARPDSPQPKKPPLQPLDFAGDRDVHDLLDAGLQAGDR